MPPYSTITAKTDHLFESNEHEKDTDLNSEEIIPQYEKYKFMFWEFETPFKWSNIILLSILHVWTIYLYLTHPYSTTCGLVLYACLLSGIGGFGITGGAHRHWAHRSYKATLPLKIILLICYSVAGQNSLVDWVRDHRVHHKYTETSADPHDAKRGFFFSHVGWLMMRKHPEVIMKGRNVDCSDLFEDPLVVFYQKYFSWLKLFFCFVLPTIIPPLVWGETWGNSIKAIVIARYITSLNIIWSLNSISHLWGPKPYDKKNTGTEFALVKIFTMGEGYHNYHHTFPWDYRAAELGSYFNVTKLWLNLFEKIGWAYDFKYASEELVQKVVMNQGDGTHYKWGHEVPYQESGNQTKVL